MAGVGVHIDPRYIMLPGGGGEGEGVEGKG